MRGKKSKPHLDPSDPPRCRANKRKGRGTYANDRPPILGTVGRESGQVRLRVAHRTDTETLSAHVHQFTQAGATVYTDEWQGYCGLNRCHSTVCHGKSLWIPIYRGDTGQQMLMGMGFERFTPTPSKAFGRPFAISCVPFGAFTRSCWPATLPYVSFASTPNSSRLTLSQNSSLALILNMSQKENTWREEKPSFFADSACPPGLDLSDDAIGEHPENRDLKTRFPPIYRSPPRFHRDRRNGICTIT